MNERVWPSMAVFGAAVAWIQVGAFDHQVLHRPELPLTGGWQMYRLRGVDVCAVSWYVQAAGALAPLDRIAALSEEGVDGLPESRRWLRTAAEVRAEARALCRSLGAEVRADAWCGTRPQGTFEAVFTTADDLCPAY